MIYSETLNETPTWISIVAAIVIVAVLVGLFIWTYLANRRTPKPAGCENLEVEKCASCEIVTCGYHVQEVSKIELTEDEQTTEEQ